MPDLIFDDVSITYRTAGRAGRDEVAAVRNVSLTLPRARRSASPGSRGPVNRPWR